MQMSLGVPPIPHEFGGGLFEISLRNILLKTAAWTVANQPYLKVDQGTGERRRINLNEHLESIHSPLNYDTGRNEGCYRSCAWHERLIYGSSGKRRQRRRRRRRRGWKASNNGARVWTMQQLCPSNELINFEMMHYIHNQLGGSYFIIRTWLKLVGREKNPLYYAEVQLMPDIVILYLDYNRKRWVSLRD